jgi:DNA recombination-dependent growth factor C
LPFPKIALSLFVAASENSSTGHAFQTYQLTNGRPGWTAGVRIKGGVFSEPAEDRCLRLLIKKLERVIPESVFREELEILDIHVQGVTQLRSGRRDQDPAKERPPTPHFIV